MDSVVCVSLFLITLCQSCLKTHLSSFMSPLLLWVFSLFSPPTYFLSSFLCLLECMTVLWSLTFKLPLRVVQQNSEQPICCFHSYHSMACDMGVLAILFLSMASGISRSSRNLSPMDTEGCQNIKHYI